ncbi:hypothetical protein FSARC_11784 [Fusarium sarcochroum]|uniref:Uncharacterized protein n=1 Tax=Fusarium sarcochroum TaxID=1208366 RepID=A0A8H4TD31_9HYPO|nr:hypothetical protein FSARC_11784 [Fusarium sarcochroum]
MPLSSFSQLADFVYPQQVIPPEECEPGQTQDPIVCGEDLASLTWEEYVRTTRPAADQSPPGPLLTQGVDAPDIEPQLIQKQFASPESPRDDQNYTPRTPSDAISVPHEDKSESPNMNAIDPRLFGGNYDPRCFVKRSPS